MTTRIGNHSDEYYEENFNLSNLTTATTREINFIDSDINLFGTTNTQTLSNKTKQIHY